MTDEAAPRRRRRKPTEEPKTATPKTAEERGVASMTIACGEEVYSPVQYNSFRVGGHSVTLTPTEGETPAMVAARGRRILEELTEAEFQNRLEGFRRRHKESKRG